MNGANDFIKSIKKNSTGISADGALIWIETDPIAIVDACDACIGKGGAFDSAFAYPSSNGKDWTVAYLFRVPKLENIAIVWSHAKQFYSISGKIPAAMWDERKMAETSGIRFFGLSDTRPIVIHPESYNLLKGKVSASLPKKQKELYKTDYAFRGTEKEGEFEIPVGPVHAGIIEPGHFRFHVTGEEINKMEVRLSYLHKGIEKILVGKPLDKAFPIIEQISGDESVANSVAYAQAVEMALGIAVPKRAESVRLLLLELERIYSHLADIGGMAMDVGFYAVSARFAALREEVMRLNEGVFSNRFLRNIISIGGAEETASAEEIAALVNDMRSISEELSRIEDLALTSSTFLDRVFLAGRVSKEAAKELSLVGPAARAAGVSCDARKHLPYGAYKTNKVIEHMAENGDVLSRLLVKINEIRESVRLIDAEIAKRVKGPISANIDNKLRNAKSGLIGVGICEAARGSSTFFLRTGKNGTIDVLLIRTSSFRNWRALEKAVMTNIVPDFPLINKSFNLSYSGADL